MQMVAVLTGDINASSHMPETVARQLEGLLRLCSEEASRMLPRAKLAAFTNFRGDAWQFIVGDPVLAPRTAILFRALLLALGERQLGRRVHTAVAIGFGGITFLPNEQSLAGGGTAYTLSGKRLDKLRRRMPGMGVSGLGTVDPLLDSLLGLIDALARQWTALQAQAISFAVQNYSQLEIAQQWQPPISQQAVNKHLRAAGWPAIEPALRFIETTLNDCIPTNNLEE